MITFFLFRVSAATFFSRFFFPTQKHHTLVFGALPRGTPSKLYDETLPLPQQLLHPLPKEMQIESAKDLELCTTIVLGHSATKSLKNTIFWCFCTKKKRCCPFAENHQTWWVATKSHQIILGVARCYFSTSIEVSHDCSF